MSELRRIVVQELNRADGGIGWQISNIKMETRDVELAASPGEMIYSMLKRFGVDVPLGECLEFANQKRGES